MEVTDIGKHSSLLKYRKKYGGKLFYSAGPSKGVESLYLFLVYFGKTSYDLRRIILRGGSAYPDSDHYVST